MNNLPAHRPTHIRAAIEGAGADPGLVHSKLGTAQTGSWAQRSLVSNPASDVLYPVCEVGSSRLPRPTCQGPLTQHLR
jgi:hypothetical protein